MLCAVILTLLGCAGHPANTFHDPEMDFSSIQSVAVMPFRNLTRDTLAAERVRDIFITSLMATGSIYVIPVGEVARGVQRVGLSDPTAIAPEDVVKLATIVKVDAVIVGTLTEYGEVRSGTAAANVVSLDLQMFDGKTGRVVWTSTSTKGGITLRDRLLGGGGEPINPTVQNAVDDLLNKFFK